MADKFADFAPSLDSPAFSAFEITPDDAADLPQVTRAIYVGGSGDLRLIMKDGSTVTFVAVAEGSPFTVRAARVLSTGTTATGLVGLY